MARTPSQMLPLGTPAPEFNLPDPDGKLHSLDSAAGSRAYVVMFICNHCPFVKHVADELARLGRDYAEQGVAIFAINSNDVENYPDDGPDAMKQESAARGYTFPYLLDADQGVAQAYEAACTPDFYLFDADRKLVYRGQLDGSRPGNDVAVDGRDLRAALDAVLAGDTVAEDQIPSLGCNIKWKPGNEPSYFG
jgi:thiol-disulfide isomerase/thioredoxin